jgi:hypothetical protein
MGRPSSQEQRLQAELEEVREEVNQARCA